MSVMDNIHFPHHVNIDEFIHDYRGKKISAGKIQKKHGISPRQYRLLVRYMREEYNTISRRNSRGICKYIYRNERDRYVIRKRKHGKFGYYGTYASLSEAIGIRDKLVENDWNKEMI